ncbi:MAG TPA: hypothetical protein VM716_10025 [Gemmatimonadales bacterium]|nr:hypothetical protein [Gemmatimonadales bacterium]
MKTAKLVAPALVVVLAACSNANSGTVSFSLTSRPSAALASGASAPGVAAAGDSTVIMLGNDSVIIRSAQLVLRKVELKRIDVASCDAIVGNGDCEEFETGSKLITLPLGNPVIAQDVAVQVPAGTFNEFELEIHKPTSSDDAAFIAANPDFATISIRVTGTYSQAGTRSAFTFTSDVDQSEQASLVPPITVAEGGTLNVTLRVNLSGWFLNAAKTALVDPASANNGQPNQSVVANNIQNSFEAFEDDNHDGQRDH